MLAFFGVLPPFQKAFGIGAIDEIGLCLHKPGWSMALPGAPFPPSHSVGLSLFYIRSDAAGGGMIDAGFCNSTILDCFSLNSFSSARMRLR